VQGPAAIAFVSSQTQVIDEHRKRRQREVMRQDHANPQRRARAALYGRDSVYAA